MSDPLEALIELVLRHDALTSAMAEAFVEHAKLMLSLLEKCSRVSCNDAATVRHQVLGLRCCDRCAAFLITKSQKSIASDDDFNMNMMRGMVAQEEMWIDLPNALAIRRAQDLVTFTSYSDDHEPDVPERGSPEWQ